MQQSSRNALFCDASRRSRTACAYERCNDPACCWCFSLTPLCRYRPKFTNMLRLVDPLLLIGGEGATANLVSRHALGVSSPNQLAAIKVLLNELATGARKLVQPDVTRVNRFDYRSLTGELADVLDVVVGAKELFVVLSL
jgi:hypothetical protein